MASPPGRATRTRPSRARRGPSTWIDARILVTSSYGVSSDNSPDESMSSRSPSLETFAPNRSSTSAMRPTSLMRGILLSVTRPGTMSDAAISLSAEFFAPLMRTVPVRGVAPSGRRTSRSHPRCGSGRGHEREQGAAAAVPCLSWLVLYLTAPRPLGGRARAPCAAPGRGPGAPCRTSSAGSGSRRRLASGGLAPAGRLAGRRLSGRRLAAPGCFAGRRLASAGGLARR